MPDSLQLYNTRTRAKQAFVPLEQGDHVRMYTCGPTVYAPQHIGNLRSQLFADLVKRTLLFAGYRVTQVINITDVGHLTNDSDAGDDKMEEAAKRSGRRAEEIAAQFTEQWSIDRTRVGCLDPEVLCKATDHIAEQIEMVKRLDEGGYAYRIDDGLYFDTARFPRYAEFARLNLTEESESRIGDVAGKRQPSDFALWKLAPEGVSRQQEWDSPWGLGFPGWHIECSAMSSKYLGDQFDIHTGGVDHVKVHHSNEIAQAECALGVSPWVNFWMHGEFLTFGKDGEETKMAKSQGNILVLDDLAASGFLDLSFRYFFLQAHYRQQQAFNDAAMEAADKGYRRLLRQAIEVRDAAGEVDDARVEPWLARFREALYDDLNAPRALATAWEVCRDEALAPADKRALLLEFDQVLALDLATAAPPEAEQESDSRIDELVAQREEARRTRDWAEADRLRDELASEGIVVTDTPDGPRWQRS